MNQPDVCCGSVVPLTYPLQTIPEIIERINDDIRQTGAAVVLTSCSACCMNLVDAVNRNNLFEVGDA